MLFLFAASEPWSEDAQLFKPDEGIAHFLGYCCICR